MAFDIYIDSFENITFMIKNLDLIIKEILKIANKDTPSVTRCTNFKSYIKRQDWFYLFFL